MHTVLPTLPVHPFLLHPRTKERLRAIYRTRTGRLVWPVMGASPDDPSNTGSATTSSGGSITVTAPAPAPPPTTAGTPAPAPAPAPAPTPAAPPAPAPAPAPPAVPVTGSGEHGFPENTPLAQMTDAQQAAYWRHYARKHEDQVKAMSDYETLKAQAAELTQLKEASMTEQQRAVAEAERRGREAALDESGGKLVEAFMRAAIGARKTPEEINALLAALDRKQFLTTDGLSVDTDKVNAFAAVVAPAPAPAPAAPAAAAPAAGGPATGTQRQVPDMGQGNRTVVNPGGLQAGREKARQMFPQQFKAQSQS